MGQRIRLVIDMVVLRLQCTLESPERLVKSHITGPSPRASDSHEV